MGFLSKCIAKRKASLVKCCIKCWEIVWLQKWDKNKKSMQLNLLHFIRRICHCSLYALRRPYSTWYFRFPLGIFFACPWRDHTLAKRSIINSAAANTRRDKFCLPLPLQYCGKNHFINSFSNPLPLIACAMDWISAGTAQTGTFLQKYEDYWFALTVNKCS